MSTLFFEELQRRGMNMPGYLRVNSYDPKKKNRNLYFQLVNCACGIANKNNLPIELQTQLKRDGLWNLIPPPKYLKNGGRKK